MGYVNMANVRTDPHDQLPYDSLMSVALPSGGRLIVLDTLGRNDIPATDRARNLVMLDDEGTVVWTVSSEFDGSGDPFTGVAVEGTAIEAYRWDGGTYAVDAETGEATPLRLDR